MVTDSDATTIAQSFLQYMQVQSLGQHYDRKVNYFYGQKANKFKAFAVQSRIFQKAATTEMILNTTLMKRILI